MSFKEQIKSDLSVFFNLDEFAEIHNINGVDMPAVIDKDALQDRPRLSEEFYHISEGVFIDSITLFVRLSDLGKRPVVGQDLKVDGRKYYVVSCNEMDGVLEIGLEAYRS